MTGIDFSNSLNPRQLEAVRRVDGAVLIIAGAGSGKTRVITCRIAYMLERGIPQSEILALTFTNKAAAEMADRVKSLTGRPLHNLTVKTFHAFGAQILRNEIEALGYRSNFSIYDESDRRQAIKDALFECGVQAEGIDVNAAEVLFSDIKTGAVDWQTGASKMNYGSESIWRGVYQTYQHNLKVYNSVDFDDLLVLPLELFRLHSDIHEKYHKRYRYIMVDEFQDTSGIQYDLLKMIALEGTHVSGGGSVNICVVGDDDQSIYSWRGANYQNIVNFERDFAPVYEIKLEQNYRSTTTILEAANGVIANNTNRKDKKLWSGNGSGKPVQLFFPANEQDEAAFIARQITLISVREQRNYSEFGILLRTNSLIQRIEEELLNQNIPYTVSGGKSFFAYKEIKDILSYLRLIGNTDDDVQLLRIINTPRRGIGKGTIEKIGALAKTAHCPLWDAMTQMRCEQNVLFEMPDQTEVGQFMTFIEKQRESILGHRGLSQKVRALVDEIDYWSYLVTEYSKNEKLARWKFLNIQKLIESIELWEKNPDNFDPTLYPYLNRISLITQGNTEEEASIKGKVNLMTIHAAKGLEFPVVFIAGAEDGLIPHKRSLEDAEQGAAADAIEEERRLFYVAITRAQDRLFLTSCRKRRRNQQDVNCVQSPFINEIPAHLLEEYEEEEAELLDPAAFFAKLNSGQA
ncbi:MAG: UvrD-helicase domain-containing protein [Spirochaetaceae bacterium]|jgi:DNA helicase-2/ATP-dependent DNA helicase PcrA|nr:UvrD-helicase domain-containing protein [Spirochaetaceae bacterium]